MVIFLVLCNSVCVCISLISACHHDWVSGWPFSLQLWQFPLRHNKGAYFHSPDLSPSISLLLLLFLLTAAFSSNIHQHHQRLGMLLLLSLDAFFSPSLFVFVPTFLPWSNLVFSLLTFPESLDWSLLVSPLIYFYLTQTQRGIKNLNAAVKHYTSNCCGAADIECAHTRKCQC